MPTPTQLPTAPSYTPGDLTSMKATYDYFAKGNAKTNADYDLYSKLAQQIQAQQLHESQVTGQATSMANNQASAQDINKFYYGLSSKDQSLLGNRFGDTIVPQAPDTPQKPHPSIIHSSSLGAPTLPTVPSSGAGLQSNLTTTPTDFSAPQSPTTSSSTAPTVSMPTVPTATDNLAGGVPSLTPKQPKVAPLGGLQTSI